MIQAKRYAFKPAFAESDYPAHVAGERGYQQSCRVATVVLTVRGIFADPVRIPGLL